MKNNKQYSNKQQHKNPTLGDLLSMRKLQQGGVPHYDLGDLGTFDVSGQNNMLPGLQNFDLSALLQNPEIGDMLRQLVDLRGSQRSSSAVHLNPVQGFYGYQQGGVPNRILPNRRQAARGYRPHFMGVLRQLFEEHYDPMNIGFNVNPMDRLNLQQGGSINNNNIPTNPSGLHKVKGPVRIPSLNLDFSGINYPVTVIPQGDGSVIEIPHFKQGGKVNRNNMKNKKQGKVAFDTVNLTLGDKKIEVTDLSGDNQMGHARQTLKDKDSPSGNKKSTKKSTSNSEGKSTPKKRNININDLLKQQAAINLLLQSTISSPLFEETSMLQGQVDQLDPNNAPGIIEQQNMGQQGVPQGTGYGQATGQDMGQDMGQMMKDGGHPLYSKGVPHYGFFGDVWGGIKDVGKGIADAALTPFGGGSLIDSGFDNIPILSDIAGFTGDLALSGLDAGTNLLGADVIGDNLYQTGLGRGFGQTVGGLGNSLGGVAVPALAGMLGIPPHLAAAARSGISQAFSGMGQGQQGYGTPGINPYGNMPEGYGGIAGGYDYSGGQYGQQYGGQQYGQQQSPNGIDQLMQLLPLLSGAFGMLNNFEDGGKVRRYKEGGFVGFPLDGIPIQTETTKKKSGDLPEQIIWPDFSITDVHARESHDNMDKNGDEDRVTDFVTEGSFITSSYGGITIKRDDADKIETNIKVYPYSEHERGKEPEVMTLADFIFPQRGTNANMKEITPAEASDNIKKKFPTQRGYKNVRGMEDYTTDIFMEQTNELNKANRAPYIKGIVQLSEWEKNKKALSSNKRQLNSRLSEVAEGLGLTDVVSDPDLKLYRKGGRVRRPLRKKGVDKAQTGITPSMEDILGIITNYQNSRMGDPMATLPTIPLPTSLESDPYLRTRPYNTELQSQNPSQPYLPQGVEDSFNQYRLDTLLNQYPQQSNTGSNPGSFYTTAAAITSGAAGVGSALNNFIGAGNLSSEIRNQRGLNQQFRDDQGGRFAAARALSSMPALLGPEAAQRESRGYLPERNATAEQRAKNALADQGVGEIASLARIGGLDPNVAFADAFKNSTAQRLQALNERLGTDFQNRMQRSQIDRENQDIDFGNETGRNNLQQSRLNTVFGNASGLMTDIAGNEAGRRFDEQRMAIDNIIQPLAYRSAGFQDLSNLGGFLMALQAQKDRQAAQRGGTSDLLSTLLQVSSSVFNKGK